jgi:hypothetical protein
MNRSPRRCCSRPSRICYWHRSAKRSRSAFGFRRTEWRRYRLLFAGGNAALLILLFLVAGFSLWLLSAVRAYVAGEGFWSKSQKDAVSHLRRYAASGSEADYQRAVPELEAYRQ